MMRRVLGLCLSLGLVACAHMNKQPGEPEPAIDVDKKDGVPGWECVKERQAGTMISRNVCRPKDGLEQHERNVGMGVDNMTRKAAQGTGR